MSLNTIVVTLIIILNLLSPGVCQSMLISLRNYALVGGNVTLGCNIKIERTTWHAVQMETYDDANSISGFAYFYKKKPVEAERLRQRKKHPDKSHTITYSWPRFKVRISPLTCGSSSIFRCTVKDNVSSSVFSVNKTLNVVDNTGEIVMNVKGPGKTCYGTENQCRLCNEFKDIQSYAEVGKSFTVDCTKKMPFPHRMENVNTFKWYHLKPTGDGYFQESEIKTNTSGTFPTFSKGDSTAIVSPFENCQRVETKTSSMIYVPTQDNGQVITIKCRIELKVENVEDSKEKQMRICLLRKWSEWTSWSKCAKTCTRLRSRKCLARECSDESKKQEACTGDLCVKEGVADKSTAYVPVAPIIGGVVVAGIIFVFTVAIWMKFRKQRVHKQTDAKPIPSVTENITQYVSDDSDKYNDTSKVSSKKEETTPSKKAGSQNKANSVKSDPKDDKKRKKTKNAYEFSERSETYYENTDEQKSHNTKQSSGTQKSKIQK